MGVKRINMGYFMATTIQRKQMQWCMNNGINISPFAHNTYEWYIDIEINGRKNRSPYLYKKVQVWEEIFNFYKYYYKKYGKNTI
jgi:hypothetical protein|tara:strand:- start:474 stop:725 length:252 start_codon:yes stop_codon:yes gene_type:complete